MSETQRSFQPDPDSITWRVHFDSSPERVYDALDTAVGRESFWAESAQEQAGAILFSFVNGISSRSTVLRRERPRAWAIEYFGSQVTFHINPDDGEGADLTMINTGVAPEDRFEVTAGWLNVLFPMKGYVDHGVDLRSHDPQRTWGDGFIDQWVA